jgi:hypothetical protein
MDLKEARNKMQVPHTGTKHNRTPHGPSCKPMGIAPSTNQTILLIIFNYNLCICVTYACQFFPLDVTGLSIAFVQALSS